jgi:hypothetical protein
VTRRIRRFVVLGAATMTAASAGTMYVLAQDDDVPCTPDTARFATVAVDYAQGTRGLPAAEAAEHALGMLPSELRDGESDQAFIVEASRVLRGGAASMSFDGVWVAFQRDRYGWRVIGFASCR